MKSPNKIYVLLILIIMILGTQSCAIINQAVTYNNYSRCPSNDPSFFYRQNNARMPRQYKKQWSQITNRSLRTYQHRIK
jgi:hypothetical protein